MTLFCGRDRIIKMKLLPKKGQSKMKKTLHIIPHSHWDREWYLPFEKHRRHLVRLFDTLIGVMEENEDYTYYHMDGQYVVIEDYLEVRPQMRDRLMKLIRAGRIRIGPWYILQDEYLTSGEANVRNMLYGIKLCRSIGAEYVETGYFPDAFGNISQAPQLLRGFGFDNAVFGRGINDVAADNELIRDKGITKSELIWRAPDGSEVIGVMFANWYHNAMELPSDPEALKTRIESIVASTSRFATTEHLLGMNGCDHQPVQTDLHKVIKAANEVQSEVEVKQSNFKDYIEAVRPYKDSFPVYEGELNGQMSTGVCPLVCTASAHVDIKQKNHDVQHLLQHIAEPVSVISMLGGGEYDSDVFLYAWKTLMQNHPHDSICTCSCDEVYEEMKSRFAKALAVGESLRDDALDYLSERIDTSAPDGIASIVLLSTTPVGSVVTVKGHVDFDMKDCVREIAIFDEEGREVPAKIKLIENQFTYTLPRDKFRRFKYVDRFEFEMQVATTGLGYRVFNVRGQTPSVKTAVKYTESSMENEYLSVTFNANGSINVKDKRTGRVYEDQNIFEDTGDKGNLYNYVQPYGDESITSALSSARVSLFEVTPFSVTFRADVPLLDDLDITTFVTLSDRVARVDFRTVVNNRREDHRLRALFTTDIKTKHVNAEGQFDVVRRDITPSPIWNNPCNAQRMQAFVTLESEDGKGDALMIATRGLCEYEVLRDSRNTLALTLLRSVSEMGDWGVFPTPLGQKKGEWELEYSFVPYDASRRAEAYSEGYSFAYPSAVAVGSTLHKGMLPSQNELVRFDNEYVRITAFKKAESGSSVILRAFNTTDSIQPLTVSLSSAFKSASLTNLAEEPVSALEIVSGEIKMDVPPKKIITVELKYS